MDIWAECRDHISRESLSNDLIRVVESQEQIATNSIVESLEEQAALEEMLEATKPSLPKNTSSLDYILATPFRYPPLKYGSRFGRRTEKSILYGSLSLETAFAETGYYRYLFWFGMTVPPPSGKFITQHTSFCVSYKTDNGLKLQSSPFSDYESILLDPSDYTGTQLLGASMRENGIDAFEYRSARDINHGLNAAIFEPTALNSNSPKNKEQWLCQINSEAVSFYTSGSNSILYKYSYESFVVNGEFPQPAV